MNINHVTYLEKLHKLQRYNSNTLQKLTNSDNYESVLCGETKDGIELMVAGK